MVFGTDPVLMNHYITINTELYVPKHDSVLTQPSAINTCNDSYIKFYSIYRM